MTSFYHALIPALWGLWLLYWIVAAIGAKPTRRMESVRSRASHYGPLILGGIVLVSPHILGKPLEGRLLPATPAWFWISVALVALGLGFASAARAWLGRNWSAVVTLKTDHELIRSGPYAWVRHPIYSGLLIALSGSALSIGNGRALVGLALVSIALLQKLTIEERFLAEQFGDAYARYRSQVPALIPFVF